MKTTYFAIFYLLTALLAYGYPPAPATQAQVNTGTEPYLYVTPKTLTGWTGAATGTNWANISGTNTSGLPIAAPNLLSAQQLTNTVTGILTASGVVTTNQIDWLNDTNALAAIRNLNIQDETVGKKLKVSVNQLKKLNCWTNLVVFGSLSPRFNPTNHTDFLGNPFTFVNEQYNTFEDGSWNMWTNYVTMPTPTLTNFTFCFAMNEDANLAYLMLHTFTGVGSGSLFLPMDVGLQSTNDNSNVLFSYSQASPYNHVYMGSSSTNYQYTGASAYTCNTNVFYEMFGDKFASTESVPITKTIYCVSVKGSNVVVYINSKPTILGVFGASYTNSLNYGSALSAVNKLFIGGGMNSWNTNKNELGDTSGFNSTGYGTNAYAKSFSGFQLFNQSVQDNSNIVQASYASLASLERGNEALALHGSSILSSSIGYTTNTTMYALHTKYPNVFFIQEAAQGGSGINAVTGLKIGIGGGGQTTSYSFQPTALTWLPFESFPKQEVCGDLPRNGSGSSASLANYIWLYNQYLNSGRQVWDILDHNGLQSPFNDRGNNAVLLQCATNFPNSKVIPEWKYYTDELCGQLGGQVHIQGQTVTTIANQVQQCFADLIMNGTWPQTFASGTNYTVTTGTFYYTNTAPYGVRVTVGGGLVTGIQHGVNNSYIQTVSMLSAALPPTTFTLNAFGDVLIITNSAAPSMFIDSTPQ